MLPGITYGSRKGSKMMGSGILTLQDCINMYENKAGYLVIAAGKILVIYTGKKNA
ncbi:MAG: hypothetical protein HFH68_06995 [Lachnospiraceae bacterium]|nr:hypothetical protein [Lachnospiraceae bacterium]